MVLIHPVQLRTTVSGQTDSRTEGIYKGNASVTGLLFQNQWYFRVE